MTGEIPNAVTLSYEPGENGASPPIFENNKEGICPVILPASGEEMLVFTSRATVMAALTSRDFGVAPLEDKHAITGAVCQRPNGMLRLDKPDITDLKRSIGPFFSKKYIEQWRPDLEHVAADLVAGMVEGPSEPDFNVAFGDPFIARASSLTAGIPVEDWPQLRGLSDATLALVENTEDIQTVRGAWTDLYKYCSDFIAQEPADAHARGIKKCH